MRIASIDIGTVTCRLCVADVSDGQLHELRAESRIVNLGEGVDECGSLDSAAIQRVCDQVERYLESLAQYCEEGQSIPVYAIATSACRDAGNASELVERLAQVGVDLHIVPGEKEAQLSFLGASADFAGEKLLVSDVGGGSTELICGIGGEGVEFSHSFDIGCRRATERILKSDPPTAEEIFQLKAWACSDFGPFFEEMGKRGFIPERFVAVAGSATSVVAVSEAMEKYDARRVHGTRVSRDTLAQVTADLAALPLAQRMNVVGLQPKRAPVIVAGMVLLETILELSGLESYTASETDILQGILMDAIAPNAAPSLLS